MGRQALAKLLKRASEVKLVDVYAAGEVLQHRCYHGLQEPQCRSRCWDLLSDLKFAFVCVLAQVPVVLFCLFVSVSEERQRSEHFAVVSLRVCPPDSQSLVSEYRNGSSSRTTNRIKFNFKSDMSESSVKHADLYVYVRSVLPRSPLAPPSRRLILVYQLLPENKRGRPRKPRLIETCKGKVTVGNGDWYHCNITRATKHWIQKPKKNVGIKVEVTDIEGNPLAVIAPADENEARVVRTDTRTHTYTCTCTHARTHACTRLSHRQPHAGQSRKSQGKCSVCVERVFVALCSAWSSSHSIRKTAVSLH